MSTADSGIYGLFQRPTGRPLLGSASASERPAGRKRGMRVRHRPGTTAPASSTRPHLDVSSPALRRDPAPDTGARPGSVPGPPSSPSPGPVCHPRPSQSTTTPVVICAVSRRPIGPAIALAAVHQQAGLIHVLEPERDGRCSPIALKVGAQTALGLDGGQILSGPGQQGKQFLPFDGELMKDDRAIIPRPRTGPSLDLMADGPATDLTPNRYEEFLDLDRRLAERPTRGHQ